MDPDESEYRKSVRNMVAVLAAISITIFAAIFVPPYLNPSHDSFQASVSYDSSFFGFTLNLTLNSTTMNPLGHVMLTAWLNSTSASIQNLTSADGWAYAHGSLWEKACVGGWPMGIGVMRGHYTEDNYTLGTPLQPALSQAQCPASSPPQYLLLYPYSSEAQASVNGTLHPWLLQLDMPFGQGSLSQGAIGGVPGPLGLPAGVYTAVVADEWGDVLAAPFLVS